MTETNAERLEEIQFQYQFAIENGIDGRLLSDSDIEWLIEQAERAQELADENFEIRKGYQEQSKRAQKLEMKYENTGSMFGRQAQQSVIDENKRFREALDVYAKNEITGVIARQALDGVNHETTKT